MSKRRHFTQSEREQWLARFDSHDSTAASFCRNHDLCYQTFLRWRRLARQQHPPSAPGPFIELELPAQSPSSAPHQTVELSFPGGLTLRILPNTSQQEP